MANFSVGVPRSSKIELFHFNLTQEGGTRDKKPHFTRKFDLEALSVHSRGATRVPPPGRPSPDRYNMSSYDAAFFADGFLWVAFAATSQVLDK